MSVENGPKAGSEALRVLDADGITVLGLVLREPSLDEVFLKLTGHRADSGPPAVATQASAESVGPRARSAR